MERKTKRTVHKAEIRTGKVAWRFEIDRSQNLVNLIYVVPAGEWAIPIPRERLPAVLAHLKRGLTELSQKLR